MAKKKGRLGRKLSSKKSLKLSKKVNSKISLKSNSIIPILLRLESQQKQILLNQKRQITEMKSSEVQLQQDIIEAETGLPNLSQDKEIAEIQRLEADIKSGVQPSPIRRITYKDVTNGFVGAFVAVVNQFAFADGFRIAEHYTIFQSSLLLLTSFFIIVLFIYYTGFRKTTDGFVFRFLPVRAGSLYLVSLLVSVMVPFAFKTLTIDMPFSVMYGTIASISVLAVLGAGTADLLGKV